MKCKTIYKAHSITAPWIVILHAKTKLNGYMYTNKCKIQILTTSAIMKGFIHQNDKTTIS